MDHFKEKRQYVFGLLAGEEHKLNQFIENYNADVEAFRKSTEYDEKHCLEKARASKKVMQMQLERYLGMLLIASIAGYIDEATLAILQEKYIKEVYE